MIVCTKIMQCGCAAALKGMAAEGNSVFGLNLSMRDAGAFRRLQVSLPKATKLQPCISVKSIGIFFEDNLPKWRSEAVARSPSLWERCACWVCAQRRVRSLLLTSKSKSRRLWRQRRIKITHCSCHGAMVRGSSEGRYSVCYIHLSAAAALSARIRGALVVARLLDTLLAFPKQTRAAHSNDMRGTHQHDRRVSDILSICAKCTIFCFSYSIKRLSPKSNMAASL